LKRQIEATNGRDGERFRYRGLPIICFLFYKLPVPKIKRKKRLKDHR
jgi:hypothetical protein